MNKKQKKLVGTAMTIVLATVLLVMPIAAAAAPIAIPIQAVSDFFKSIGDFVFGESDEGDDLIDLLKYTLSQDDTKIQIAKTYNHIFLEYKDVSIEKHRYIIIQYLAGYEYEDMTDDMIRKLIDASLREGVVETVDDEGNGSTKTTRELVSVEEYIESLRAIEPFSSDFAFITTQTLSEIINAVGSLEIYVKLPQELIDKYVGKMMYPFEKRWPISAKFGWYDPENSGVLKEHRGTDVAAPCGTAIYAIESGTVVFSNKNAPVRSWGNYVTIKVDEFIQYRVFHMQVSTPLSIGQPVEKGDYIGVVGNTGYSFGCHLHLEILVDGQAVDAENFVDFSN